MFHNFVNWRKDNDVDNVIEVSYSCHLFMSMLLTAYDLDFPYHLLVTDYNIDIRFP
jgi:hypothetical protein